MKILNVSEGTVYLDDINLPVLYSRDRVPQEIDDRVARQSFHLKYAIKTKMLYDVTDGIPADLPKQPVTAPPQPKDHGDSPFMEQQGMLVKDDHFSHAHEGPREAPKKGGPSAKELYAKDGQINVAFTGPALDGGGYARMNRRFMLGLSDLGVKVRYDVLPSKDDMDPATRARLSRLEKTTIPADAPKVYGMTAPLHYDWDRYKILFTMMETRRLHKDYVIRCNCADEIIVPSRWCKQVFEESGVTKPIAVVPLGVDTGLYRPDAPPIGFSKSLKDFVFLSVFGWSLRKGYDVLLKAYFEEFTADEPVTLLLSTRYFGSSDESKKKVIRDEIARIRSQCRNKRQPHLMFFGDVLFDDMMPSLYTASDCYVLISRGEGFGLPFIEAASCGLPVISSRYSGQTDFLDDQNSWLVDVDGFQSAEKDLAWISYFYEDAEFPIFGQAAVEQTRRFMRQAFEDKEQRERKAALLSAKIRGEYDWSNAVAQMHAKLKATFENWR